MNIEYIKNIFIIYIYIYCSDFIEKKYKFIVELDELNKPKEQTLFDQYEKTKYFWNQPMFQNVVKYILEKNKNEIIETNTSSLSETNN